MAQGTTSKPALPQMKPASRAKFHARLAGWYQAHGRHTLPWRQTDDPYRIWLSEVMLQQTQVATVLARFYHPFLEKFPTVKDLAAAPREAVMKAWEGLGYYRRAANLHEAAKQIAGLSPRFASATPGSTLDTKKEDGPRRKAGVTGSGCVAFPDTVEGLLALPGIGQNTAHAIAAFAYHQPVAILEANVKRVVARIFALETPNDKELWAGAEALLNRAAPFDYNQAMMDLGSMICTPKNPRCGECPANSICTGKVAPERYPAPKAKKQVPTKEVMILVREDAAGRFYLERRDAALLGGLYGFPQKEVPGSGIQVSGKKDAETWKLEAGTFLGRVPHVYSHFKLIGHVVHELVAKANAPDWHSITEIAALPLSKLDHKVLELVENCHSREKNAPIGTRKRRTR